MRSVMNSAFGLALAMAVLTAPAALAGSNSGSNQTLDTLRQQQLEFEIQNSMRSREIYNAQQQIYRQQDRQNASQPQPRPEVPVMNQPCQIGARGVATGGC